MIFEKGFIYHVFNRGNNGEKLFYSHSNYRYFTKKICFHILPYADILAWCLMPNHFHLMVYVRREKILTTTINQSIGKMLSSYARAINIQERRTGSLFQQHTKAINLNSNDRLKPSWYKMMGVTKAIGWNNQSDYPKVCLEYIHRNPVSAGLVNDVKDWQWSSYREIFETEINYGLVSIGTLKSVVPL